jgi:hypothetical protein
MDVKKLLADVSRHDWGGHPVSSLRTHLMEVYSLIDWFFEKTTNEYLGQNEGSVLNSIHKDKVPQAFKKVLLEAEKTGKNRPKVIKALE